MSVQVQYMGNVNPDYAVMVQNGLLVNVRMIAYVVAWHGMVWCGVVWCGGV
jgi:hypothetical protein